MPDDSIGSIDDTMQETLASIESGERDEGNAEPAGGDTSIAGPDSQRAAPAAPSAPPPEPWRAPPQSWKKEMGEYWGRQDPQVMQYIHQREQEALRGISMYKQQADAWNKALSPYDQYMKQYNVNPQEATSALMAAHLILQHGTAEQKAQAVAILDRDYNLRQYLAPQQGQPQQPRGPDLQPLNNRIASIEAQFQRQAESEAMTAVDRFIADPANKYAAEAAPKMLEHLEHGRASNLAEAYDLAVRTDPVLFEKLVSERIAAATATPARAPSNTRPSAVPPSTAGKVRGTIEDTMRETLSRMNNR
jgi:hypothetical protein